MNKLLNDIKHKLFELSEFYSGSIEIFVVVVVVVVMSGRRTIKSCSSCSVFDIYCSKLSLATYSEIKTLWTDFVPAELRASKYSRHKLAGS